MPVSSAIEIDGMVARKPAHGRAVAAEAPSDGCLLDLTRLIVPVAPKTLYVLSKHCARSTSAAAGLLRIVGPASLELTADELSVHPAANDDGPPWRNNHSTSYNRRSDDHRAACGDAARTIDAARADDGACFHRVQGDEASCQE